MSALIQRHASLLVFLAVLLFWMIGSRVLRRAAAPAPRPRRVNVRLQSQEAAALPEPSMAMDMAEPTAPSLPGPASAGEPSPLASLPEMPSEVAFDWEAHGVSTSAPKEAAPGTTPVRKAALERPTALVNIIEQWVGKSEEG